MPPTPISAPESNRPKSASPRCENRLVPLAHSSQRRARKLKSFMLALGDERLYLHHLECCEAYDHDILAERESSATGRSLVRWSVWFGLHVLSVFVSPGNVT